MNTSEPIKVFALNVQKRMKAELVDELMNKIDDHKKKRISKFYKWEDVQRTLLAELLIRSIVINLTGLKNSDISFSTSIFGKPILINHPHLHFNGSHSGEWVVCAVHNKEVGIDVELITEIDLSISENFFFTSEHNDIINNSNPKDKFFEYWTLKESYIKFIGKGLTHPLNAFSIKFIDEAIHIQIDNKLNRDVFFKQYKITPGYKMAVCATHNNFENNIAILTIEEIIKTVNI